MSNIKILSRRAASSFELPHFYSYFFQALGSVRFAEVLVELYGFMPSIMGGVEFNNHLLFSKFRDYLEQVVISQLKLCYQLL